MLATRLLVLGSILVLGKAARVHQADLASSQQADALSTALELNAYIISWVNRAGAGIYKQLRKLGGGDLVVPAKCSDNAVWVDVGKGLEEDDTSTTHCIQVTCNSDATVATQKLDECPWGESGRHPRDFVDPRVIQLGDPYLMKEGKWSKMRHHVSDEGYTALSLTSGAAVGKADKAAKSDRGWEVSAESVSSQVPYDFRHHWITSQHCRNLLATENKAGLPLPRDASSTQACKSAAETKSQECLAAAEKLKDQSAWWWKFVYFGDHGNKLGNTWEMVEEKYEACKEFGKEATLDKYRARKEDTRASPIPPFFAFFAGGQSWEYQCQEAMDADAEHAKDGCGSRAWWCTSKDVQACMPEQFLPQEK